MQKLKYRIVPQGAADGVVPLNWVFLDRKDIEALGLTHLEACKIIAKELGDDCAAVNIMDMDSVTVTSDGIMVDGAVCGLASVDHGMINKDFGYMKVSEFKEYEGMMEAETHMKQWLTDYYKGKPLHRGPSTKDRGIRVGHNENMTLTGRIANNNVGSEAMNMVDMTEILVPLLGMHEIMHGGTVNIGVAGPMVSVGIGMVVSELQGRIFGYTSLGAYRAGMSAHNSGKYAKTVKSDYPAIVSTKPILAEYTLRALDCGMVPGRDIGCSPAVLSLAKAYGKPIDFDNISERAWIELESVGMGRAKLEEATPVMSREEIIAKADSIIPGMEDAKTYAVSDICEIRYAEF